MECDFDLFLLDSGSFVYLVTASFIYTILIFNPFGAKGSSAPWLGMLI